MSRIGSSSLLWHWWRAWPWPRPCSPRRLVGTVVGHWECGCYDGDVWWCHVRYCSESIHAVLIVLRKMGLITFCFASCIIICKSWNASMQFWWQFLDPTKEPATPDYDNVPSALPSDWVDGERSHTKKDKARNMERRPSKLHIVSRIYCALRILTPLKVAILRTRTFAFQVQTPL